MNKSIKKLPISVVVTAYNEVIKLPECLESISFADEIIVVDSSSIDGTAQLAKKYTSHIFTKPNNLMLNVNKNFGFTKAKNDWILSLDADERITPELTEEIKKIIMNHKENINGYWIPRKNMIFGKWIQNSIWWPDYQLRLFKKGKGKFAEVDVHEMLEVQGETEKLENPMVHLNYESVTQFIKKMDTIYTENAAENYIASNKEFAWYDVIRMPVSDFLKTFFLQKGYKDGLHGLVLSLLQSFYSVVVFAKVWERTGFPEYNSNNFIKDVIKEFNKAAREFQYWILTSMVDDTKKNTKKIYYKLLRKLAKRHLS